jgi:soluble lytic murein transglycosylase-like protein
MNWQESRGDTRAPGGGLGQMTNERFADLQTRHPQLAGKRLSEPGTNILATAFFMQDLLRQFGGNMKLALRAYNSGENGVDPNDPNATPAGTGDPTYVTKVVSMASRIDSGGDLPP